ncbi:MAG: heat-inducible transcriptional repressor HrcA [Hellea sp.]|nr:heat-inducible transcriptional repressor HrcA [Hellea sp.]
MSFSPEHFSLSDLDSRTRAIFKDIVESYLDTGQPVGSRTLAMSSGQQLSPATIRNTMSDLMRLGLLQSPHKSAGRLPSQIGLRLFVDGLLEIGDLSAKDRGGLENSLSSAGEAPTKIFEQASAMLAGLAGGAGLVLTPDGADRTGAVKHVEFVNLDSHQALVVIVYEDGRVENRLMDRPAGLVPASLEQAGNFLSARLKGKRLSDAKTQILSEIKSGEAQIDQAAAGLVAKGLADWSGAQDRERSLIIRGRAQLLENIDAQADIERIQMLFEDLERKQALIELLDRTEDADGVKIFIGTENPLFSLSDSSVVVAPYRDSDRNIIGAVGVIGPTRLNYARIIPMVDYTAQLVGRLLR